MLQEAGLDFEVLTDDSKLWTDPRDPDRRVAVTLAIAARAPRPPERVTSAGVERTDAYRTGAERTGVEPGEVEGGTAGDVQGGVQSGFQGGVQSGFQGGVQGAIDDLLQEWRRASDPTAIAVTS